MFIPKTGSCSVKAAILQTYGYRVPKVAELLPRTKLRLISNHPGFHFITNEQIQNNYSNHTIVTFVRDPVERLVSVYKDKGSAPVGRRGLTFNDFINQVFITIDTAVERHIKSQTFLLQHSHIYPGRLLPNLIGYYDTLQYGWRILMQEFNLAPLPHINKSPQQEIEISDATKEKIIKRYAEDYCYFDFSASNGEGAQRGGICVSRSQQSHLHEYDGDSSETDIRRF
jgi:hypothetical protein